MKQAGFIGGGGQIFSGFGICGSSMGAACAAYGMPLIAHGINNVYENGYYLIFRKDKQGYVRDGYRTVAKQLGYTSQQADTAYASVDIALSLYGLAKKSPKQDSWRLFNHINSDFIRGWQLMGKIPLTAELAGDGITAYGIYQLSNGG
ncbi:DUF4225 domain-containing protein [Erwinia amylovora]|nr:DUF4225 domain-containing protein [Erwinia amylovora]